MEKKVGYCYPSGLEKTLCKWDIYVPLVTKGLIKQQIYKEVTQNQDEDPTILLCSYQVSTSKMQDNISKILFT
jgi:hypothetical protein